MKLNSVTKKEKNLVELSITVEQAELEAATERAYRQGVGKIAIPGYRKGKAPRKMIEKMYGAGFFMEEAMNICFPEAYNKAIEEAQIEPINQASIEIAPDDETGLTFIASVEVTPEVVVKNYKGLSAVKADAEVTDMEVEAEIGRLAKQSARLISVERPIKDGDTISLDFEGFIDDVAFEGGKGENFDLKIGSGMFIPGFEEQLVGKNVGEECDVNVSFPEEYGAQELAGKPAVFKCKVNEVKEEELPEIDDEFAKDVSEFETLEQLKEDMKNRMAEQKARSVENSFEVGLVDAMLEGFECEVPESMIESQLERTVEDFGYRLAMQGMDLDTYLSMQGMEINSFKIIFRPQAEKQVKVRLALVQIANNENLVVSDEMLEDEFKSLADQNHMDIEKVKSLIPAKSLRGDMMSQKAMEFIKENATALAAPATQDGEDKKAKKPAAKKEKAEDTAEKPKRAKKAKKEEEAE